jgi:hypothetical protein
MNRDQLADWLHCLHGGMYDWVIDEIKSELAKPEQANEFYPDWNMLQPFHDRIKELEAELAKPEQDVYTNQQNLNTSEKHIQKPDK